MEIENVNDKARDAFGLGLTGTITGGLSILSMLGGVIGMHALNGNGRAYGYMGDNGCAPYVTKSELNYVQEIGKKDAEIALLKSEQNTEVKIADVYERLITRINADRKDQTDWNASQSVINAKVSGAIATNTNSINDLQHVCRELTKIVIPADNVCPKPMPQFNSWTAPTAAATPTT